MAFAATIVQSDYTIFSMAIGGTSADAKPTHAKRESFPDIIKKRKVTGTRIIRSL